MHVPRPVCKGTGHLPVTATTQTCGDQCFSKPENFRWSLSALATMLLIRSYTGLNAAGGSGASEPSRICAAVNPCPYSALIVIRIQADVTASHRGIEQQPACTRHGCMMHLAWLTHGGYLLQF